MMGNSAFSRFLNGDTRDIVSSGAERHERLSRRASLAAVAWEVRDVVADKRRGGCAVHLAGLDIVKPARSDVVA